VTCWFAVSDHTHVPLEQVAGEPPEGPDTLPEPEIVTESRGGPKLADTLLASVIVTAHTLFRPEQAPVQPLKTEPADGVAMRYAVEPWVCGALQVVPAAPHAIAPVPEPPVTLPVPVPVVCAERRMSGEVNVAATLLAASIVTWHAPFPEQAPDQPAKSEYASGVAVTVTTVP
jgi:hypothetical protein